MCSMYSVGVVFSCGALQVVASNLSPWQQSRLFDVSLISLWPTAHLNEQFPLLEPSLGDKRCSVEALSASLFGDST